MLVSPYLRQIREQYLDANSPSSMSVLLSLTNNILSKCATLTNKSRKLGIKMKAKPKSTPKPIKKAKDAMSKAHKKFKSGTGITLSKDAFNISRKKYRKAVRQFRIQEALKRDQNHDSILSTNPASAYKYINSKRKVKSGQIEHLTVGDKVYVGQTVCDGFYDSMSTLKQCDYEQLKSDPDISMHLSNYEHIMKICQDQHSIPSISHAESSKILGRMKKNVNDFFSITALHYINAGEEGSLHLNEVLNAMISDVNNCSAGELNLAYGIILYKGHRKLKTSDSSYRTISTCPFLAKCLDLYLRDLYLDQWNALQADNPIPG